MARRPDPMVPVRFRQYLQRLAIGASFSIPCRLVALR